VKKKKQKKSVVRRRKTNVLIKRLFSHASIPVVQKESIHLNYGFTLAMQAVHMVEEGGIYEEGQSP
jgi:hypothetical protein